MPTVLVCVAVAFSPSQRTLNDFEKRWKWLLSAMRVYGKKAQILTNSEFIFRSAEEQATQDVFYEGMHWLIDPLIMGRVLWESDGLIAQRQSGCCLLVLILLWLSSRTWCLPCSPESAS